MKFDLLLIISCILVIQNTLSFSIQSPKSQPRSDVKLIRTILPSNVKLSQTQLFMAIKGPVRYSTNDWFECLTTLPSSRILARVKYNILFFTLWTFAITFLYKHLSLKFTLPSAIHSVLGSALGLLLVFRTNASYDRFWEGRKCWSQIITACRDIANLTWVHIDKNHHKEIANLLVLYVVTLKQHIQGERIISELIPFATEDNCVQIQSFKNRPNHLLRLIHEKVHHLLHRTDNSVSATLHEHTFYESLHSMSVAATNCERIVKQPIPLAYTRHTSRFLSFYLLSLPFSMITSLGWWTVPVMCGMCWSFASIQEIGLFIEDPFNKDFQIIPLNQLISVIRTDISESLDGVIDSPEMVKFDQKLLESAKERARLKDDSWFAYY